MKRMTPILTLASGTVLAAVLFTMSAQAAPPAPAADAGQATAAPPTADAGAAPEAPDAAGPPTGEPAAPGAQPGAQPGATSPPAETPAPGSAVEGTWTGRLDGGATIALTVRQGRAVAYVCDGRSLEIWLRGTVSGSALDLAGADGARLTGTIDGNRVNGEVSVGDKRLAFTAAATGGTSPALYRATAQVRDAGVDGGWILLADGTQVGVVTWNGKPVPAPPLDPAFGTTIINGITITAVPVLPDAGTGR